MNILTNEQDIMQMARDERCSYYTADLLVQDLNKLISLRKAGEKMAKMLKFLQLQNDAAHLESAGLWSVNGETEIQVAEAREAWEAANK